MGFHISIPGTVTFKNAFRVQDVASRIPFDRLLVETDAPFLSPVKGERNFPWNIIRSAEKIADLRGLDSSDILNAARENAIRVFGLRLEK